MTGIITQGARDFGHIQYVAAYKVAYGDDGVNWTEYRDQGAVESKVSVCSAVLPSPLQGCPASGIRGPKGRKAGSGALLTPSVSLDLPWQHGQ